MVQELTSICGGDQQKMQMLMQQRMMLEQMAATAVGHSFSAMSDEMTEEQSAITKEVMDRCRAAPDAEEFKEGVTEQQGSSMMEPAMGKCMKSFSPEQRSAYERRVSDFIAQHIPDDTTRSFVKFCTKCAAAQLGRTWPTAALCPGTPAS